MSIYDCLPLYVIHHLWLKQCSHIYTNNIPLGYIEFLNIQLYLIASGYIKSVTVNNNFTQMSKSKYLADAGKYW